MRTLIDTVFKVDGSKYTKEKMDGAIGVIIPVLDFIIPKKGSMKKLLGVIEKVKGIFGNSAEVISIIDDGYISITIQYHDTSLHQNVSDFYTIKTNYEGILNEGLLLDKLGECKLIIYAHTVFN